MHQSEQSRNRSLQILRDKKSSVLKSRGDSEFFGYADKNEGNVIALKFITTLGEQKAIHYHDIVSPMDYNGETEIRLSTTRLAIIINGKNLDDLFDHIIQHQVKWVKEPDNDFPMIGESEVEISYIRFEPLQ
ncbi:MAG: hypothetical protein R2824_16020 [Saprospiraceae bacterium]